MLTQVLSPQCTVKADADRIGVTDRIPEGLCRLPGQGTTGGIGYGAGNHHRQFYTHVREGFIDGKDRRLGIQGIKNGFDHDQVGPAVNQTPGRLYRLGYLCRCRLYFWLLRD